MRSGRAGSIFSFGVATMLGRDLDDQVLAWIAQVSKATDRQLATEGSGVTHGAQAVRLAVDLGVPTALAQRCGVWLDGLEIALDLADNLADAEQDRQQGRDYSPEYGPVPGPALHALPLLILSILQAELWRMSAPPSHRVYASERFNQVLGRMVRGQGRSEHDPQRLEDVSAVQGRLYLLPFWLHAGPSAEEDPDFQALEGWLMAWGRTWQARRDHAEGALDRVGLEAVLDRAEAAWPSFGPFQPGGTFDMRLLEAARP